jgi:hypothetical protein
MKNNYVQAIIITLAAAAVQYLPGGSYISCLIVIGLILYFSKQQSKENANYGIKSGALFGLQYTLVNTVFSFIFSFIFFDFLRNQFISELEKTIDEQTDDQAIQGLETILDWLTDVSQSELMLWSLGITFITALVVGLISGSIAGLIFEREEE